MYLRLFEAYTGWLILLVYVTDRSTRSQTHDYYKYYSNDGLIIADPAHGADGRVLLQVWAQLSTGRVVFQQCTTQKQQEIKKRASGRVGYSDVELEGNG